MTMSNREVSAARYYHEATKHSYTRLLADRFTLDWANKPIPYKIYTTLEPYARLPADFPPSSVSALDAIAAADEPPDGERVPDLQTLARLCYFSNGVTKVLRRGGEAIAFRAASCTGALYHVELYLVCGDLPDLPAGVYHFGAHDNGLRRLRAGDFRQVLVDATGAEPSVATAPVVVICTSTFWRNAWKYRARAYRHSFWDTGTILANLLAVAAARELPAKVVLGFADEPVNCLLDVEPHREAAISLVALGRTGQAPPPAPPVQPLNLPVAPLSPREVVYPEIQAMHAASSLSSGEEAAAWRGPPPAHPLPPPTGRVIPLRPLDPAETPGDPIEVVIRRRGSSRRFVREPITFEQLSTIVERATRGIPADYLSPGGWLLNDLYLLVNAVDGLPSGAYVFHRDRQVLELLKAGTFRSEAGWLALGQELGADAAVDVYFLSDLEPILARFGNRGYRAAQLTAAIMAGKMYLAAYALRLGATGLTFFDDDVTAFFSPHAAGKSVMFLIALGRPGRGRA
jgi:SagB-type dehydrogenase family enzyme